MRRRGKTPRHRRWLIAGGVLLALLLGAGIWYWANLDDILEERYQKGLALRAAGEYVAAAELLRKLQADHPDCSRAPEALLQAGQLLHLNLGRYQDALLVYVTVERDYPEAGEATEARRQVAELYKYRLNDQQRALSAYQRLLDDAGAEGDRVQYEVADCYFRLNNFEQARIEFENLQQDYPASPLGAEVRYRIAVTYALEGKADDAMNAYREVISRWPESPYAVEARFGLATALEERERIKEALEIFEGLRGIYSNQQALAQRIESLKARVGQRL